MNNIRTIAVWAALALLGAGLAACDSKPVNQADLPTEAVVGNGQTPYPGKLDERLTKDQRQELRARGELQK